MSTRSDRLTELFFRVGMAIKGFDSLLEVLGGIALTMPFKVQRLLLLASQHEAFRHHEAMSGRLGRLAETVTTHPSMGTAAYLMVHGGIKVFLIAAILKGYRWAYLWLIGVLTVFTVVEVTRAAMRQEIVTAAFGALDLVVVMLIYREFKMRFRESPAQVVG